MQAELFSQIADEDGQVDIFELEQLINNWLSKNKVTVKHINQTMDAVSVLISIWYEPEVKIG